MKENSILMLILFIFALFSGCSSNFEKIAESNVNATMKATAEEIGNDLLVAQREGRFESLGEEATRVMRSKYTPENQKKSYEILMGIVGEYKSMEYAETWVTKEKPLLYIFRFKGEFSKNQNAEVRVVLDGKGKLTGFWVKPWRATLQ